MHTSRQRLAYGPLSISRYGISGGIADSKARNTDGLSPTSLNSKKGGGKGGKGFNSGGSVKPTPAAAPVKSPQAVVKVKEPEPAAVEAKQSQPAEAVAGRDNNDDNNKKSEQAVVDVEPVMAAKKPAAPAPAVVAAEPVKKVPVAMIKDDEPKAQEIKAEAEAAAVIIEKVPEPEPESEPVVVKAEPVMAEPVVEAEVEAVPEKPLSIEDELRREVAQEFETRERRLGELSQLQSELSQSMRKKDEVEQVIRRELTALWPRLQDEFYKETARVDQLVGSATKFQEALDTKSAVAETEDITLGQMRDVRNKVSEPAILSQLDDAISKKTELIRIEKAVCIEIKECIVALNAQISDTRDKLSSLNTAIMNLPASEDTVAARSYTWDDVASLQEVLYKSMDESKARDQVVSSFIFKFEDAMRQKGLVLGENTDLPPAVSAATGVRSSQIPKKLVDNNKATPARKKIEVATPAQMAELMKKKSNEELSQTATGALKRTLAALTKLTAGIFEAGKRFSASDDAKVTGQMASSSVDSLTKTGETLQQALKLTADTWEEALQGESAGVLEGGKAVLDSRDVRNAIKGVGEGAAKSATSAVDALKLVAGGVGMELQTDRVAMATAELQEALTELAAIVAVGTTRVAGAIQDQSRQLPPINK
jgi:hypothetical protein